MDARLSFLLLLPQPVQFATRHLTLCLLLLPPFSCFSSVTFCEVFFFLSSFFLLFFLWQTCLRWSGSYEVPHVLEVLRRWQWWRYPRPTQKSRGNHQSSGGDKAAEGPQQPHLCEAKAAAIEAEAASAAATKATSGSYPRRFGVLETTETTHRQQSRPGNEQERQDRKSASASAAKTHAEVELPDPAADTALRGPSLQPRTPGPAHPRPAPELRWQPREPPELPEQAQHPRLQEDEHRRPRGPPALHFLLGPEKQEVPAARRLPQGAHEDRAGDDGPAERHRPGLHPPQGQRPA